jgi:hypothetical protein
MRWGCLAMAAGALVLCLAGCVGWNETGIWRAERRVRRIFRPGMTALETWDAAVEHGMDWYPPRGDQTAVVCTGEVQKLYIGTASLVVFLHLDEEGRVREVTTKVNTAYL